MADASILPENVKSIPLSQDKFALVDATDYEWLSGWRWHYTHGYAKRRQYGGGGKNNNKDKHIYMHNVLLCTPQGMDTDHINGDKLDNRRCNLRLATRSQNNYNGKKRNGCTSRHKGIYWSKIRNRWVAEITINKKKFYLGSFKSEAKAALAYNEAAIKHHSEFARLNVL